MPYEVFEAVGADEGPLAVDAVLTAGKGQGIRTVGIYASWEGALREIARLEARARRRLRGAGGFALGIRAESA